LHTLTYVYIDDVLIVAETKDETLPIADCARNLEQGWIFI